MTRKLIEVALPLAAISAASRRDKDRKTGTIKNVHKWFAPMPTPAWRALLFASIVDDPGTDAERQDLLDLITELVGFDGELPTPSVLERAQKIMADNGPLPTVLDPFCGGGSTVIEAQRLGLPAAGSDLNPVPVLITKVLCELLPSIAGRPAMFASEHLEGTGGPYDGFSADLRFWAERVEARAKDRVGHLYSAVPGATVVAWIWARTVPCVNPACGATIPLYSSPWLSKQRKKERWVKLCNEGTRIWFEVGSGTPVMTPSTKAARGAKFLCPACSTSTTDATVRSLGRDGAMGTQLLAVAVKRGGEREFLSPGAVAEAPLLEAPTGLLDLDTPSYTRDFKLPNYGLKRWADIFTTRQLHMLQAFAEIVDSLPEEMAGAGAERPYVEAIVGVLGLSIGKMAISNSTQVRWRTREGPPKAEPAFGRQALPMVWDFAEANPFGDSVGAWSVVVHSTLTGLKPLAAHAQPALISQADARVAGANTEAGSALVATDPPYFAQIGYADLSDYFYLWHRLALRRTFPGLYGTMTAPKEGELVAMPHRHGDDTAAAYDYYVEGFTQTFRNLALAQRHDLPMVVIYAHRQEESDGDDGLTSSAWDALLEAMLRAGVGVVGTWPIHATSSSRQIGQGTNSLASYVVLVCRPRSADAGITDRPGFVRALRAKLPPAMAALQAASTLPFDVTQAAIGPGMATFSQFARVVEPSGEAMRVRTAIGLINQVRSEILSEQDDEFDSETRWAVQWYERYAFDVGPFGEAEKLFTATATSLDGLRRTGIVGTKAPNVWLLEPESLPPDWDPVSDLKTCTWEVTMHLIRVLHFGGGEHQAAALLGKVGRFGELAHDLAYRIADVCEATKRANTALLVNGLIASWPEISRLAASGAPSPDSQGTMF